MSAEYELILMLDPEVPDERREEIAGNARQRIDDAGTLRHSDGWGVRKLAYEIKLRNEADYRFYRFEAEAPLLEDLDHALKITDGILRFRLFKVDPRAPLIDPPAVAQLAAPRGGRREERGRGGRGRRDERPDEGDVGEAPAEPVPPAAEEPAPAEEPSAPAEEPSAPAEEDPAPQPEPAEQS